MPFKALYKCNKWRMKKKNAKRISISDNSKYTERNIKISGTRSAAAKTE